MSAPSSARAMIVIVRAFIASSTRTASSVLFQRAVRPAAQRGKIVA